MSVLVGDDDTVRLSRRECAAVASYIWQHCRAYPTSAAYRVWQKMFACAYGEKEVSDKEAAASHRVGRVGQGDGAGDVTQPGLLGDVGIETEKEGGKE